MAAVVHEHVDVPLEGFRISWGGIWAGVLTAMGTLLFLSTLGLAIGISAADPRNADVGALGTGAAIWTGLSLLIALFVGGLAATRLGMVFDRAAGAFEGALVWVLSFLIIFWLASSGVRLLTSGIAGVFGGVTQTITSAASGMGDLSSGDVNQMIARLNDPTTASTIAAATGMPEEEVRSSLSQLAQRVEAVRDNPQQAAAAVREGTQQFVNRARAQLPVVAERAQQGATKTAWYTFAAMLISLAAAIGGAMLGRRRVEERLVRSVDSTVRDSTVR